MYAAPSALAMAHRRRSQHKSANEAPGGGGGTGRLLAMSECHASQNWSNWCTGAVGVWGGPLINTWPTHFVTTSLSGSCAPRRTLTMGMAEGAERLCPRLWEVGRRDVCSTGVAIRISSLHTGTRHTRRYSEIGGCQNSHWQLEFPNSANSGFSLDLRQFSFSFGLETPSPRGASINEIGQKCGRTCTPLFAPAWGDRGESSC